MFFYMGVFFVVVVFGGVEKIISVDVVNWSMVKMIE